MLTIPKTIKKDEIAALGNLRETTNAYAFTIDGVSYPPGTLVFKGFAGMHQGDHVFAGDLRFDPRLKEATEGLPQFDFGKLLTPATLPKGQAQPAGKEATADE